jgi:hypothetical protein
MLRYDSTIEQPAIVSNNYESDENSHQPIYLGKFGTLKINSKIDIGNITHCLLWLTSEQV